MQCKLKLSIIWASTGENPSSGFANIKGADLPAQPHSLFSSFVISLLESMISKFATSKILIFIPPANFVCRGYTVFILSVRPSMRPSVTLCFLNNSKSQCWIFIKPCKHVHICKTNTLDKKVRARGQLY